MTSSRCSACSYAMAMRRAAKEVLLLAWTSAVVLVLAFVAAGLFVSTEAARGIADFIEPKRERTCRNISTVPCKFTCSECHQSWRKANGNGAFAYCPNCGARVVPNE